jgi:hypothetical protein
MRRYVIALFAACVALAAGIALGAGPLQGAASADGSGSSVDTSALRDQVSSLQAAQVFGSAVTDATSDQVVAHRLAGATVTLIVLPGVSDDTVAGLRDAVIRAGGSVSVTARLAERAVDPAQKTYVTSVAVSSLKGLGDLSAVAHAQPYAQLGGLLARAYAGKGSSLSLDDEAIKIDSELQGAKLVSLAAHPHRRGSLVVVLGEGEHGRDDVTAATHVIELQILSSLTTGADAVLVATPPTGSSPGGLLSAIASASSARRSLSTLNVTDGPAAEIAAVFALAAASDGTVGTYGATGQTIALPPGLAEHGG